MGFYIRATVVRSHVVLTGKQKTKNLMFFHTELRNGVPALSINHGSGTLTLQLPPKSTVTDRRWHRLDVVSDGKVGRTDGRTDGRRIEETDQ